MFFLHGMFLIMSPVTATTTTSPVTVSCSRESPITMTVTVAPISMDLAALGQHDVVLPPQLVPGDKMLGSVSLTTVLQQQSPQSQMPYETYVSYAMSFPQVSFLFQS